MQYISPNLCSKLSLDEFEARLTLPGKRLVISDIDGTLHKGLLFGKYNLTYVDIALYLLPQLVSSPKQFAAFACTLGEIFCSELMKRNEEHHITQFVHGLYGVNISLLEDACRKVAAHIDPYAVQALQLIVHDKAAVYLASKSLVPTGQAYQQQLSEMLKRTVTGCFNPLCTLNGSIIGVEKMVVTAMQKKEHVERTIASYSPEQIIAFADSKEDARFMQLCYPPNSLRIAIHPKDDAIKEATDVWCWSWKELSHFISTVMQHVPEQCSLSLP